MELWIWVTVIAALSQSIRSAQQKRLKNILGDVGASYVRFLYAIPFAWLGLLGYSLIFNETLPTLNYIFLLWVTAAGILQIIFTVLLIKLFSLKSFASATAFSKTEVIQAIFFESIILGTITSMQTNLAICLGFIAIILLAVAKGQISLSNIIYSFSTRQVILGLLCGALLALCSVFFRAATDSLEGNNLFIKAGTTLGVSVIIQTFVMGTWMINYTSSEFILSLKYWRSSISVGFFGALTSFCWFYAFSANAVAPVRAVGQIELIIAIFFSIFFFRERPILKEILAILLLLISILMILFD